jgi:hypothetical protein
MVTQTVEVTRNDVHEPDDHERECQRPEQRDESDDASENDDVAPIRSLPVVPDGHRCFQSRVADNPQVDHGNGQHRQVVDGYSDHGQPAHVREGDLAMVVVGEVLELTEDKRGQHEETRGDPLQRDESQSELMVSQLFVFVENITEKMKTSLQQVRLIDRTEADEQNIEAQVTPAVVERDILVEIAVKVVSVHVDGGQRTDDDRRVGIAREKDRRVDRISSAIERDEKQNGHRGH